MSISACGLWHSIGLQLNAPKKILDDIKVSNRDQSEICLLSMIDYCIKSDNGLTWRRLCQALNSSTVNQTQLASDIEEWLIKNLQPTSKFYHRY